MAIAFVQSGTARATGAVSKAFTSNNAAGNLIVVAILLEHSTDTIASVVDTRGNTYTIAGVLQGSAGSGYQSVIYYAKNIAAGANTVTVTPTTGTTPVDIAIHEYSGADTTAPLDQAASATAVSTTPSSGSVTTTAANELIFGIIVDNATVTVDASLTTRHDFTFNYFTYSVDKIAGAAGSYAVNGTAANNRWAVNVATFKTPAAVVGQTYAELLASTAPSVAVLVEIQPAEQLGVFVLDSGVVYKITWPKYVQTQVPGGLYRRLDFVRENTMTYSAQTSVAACQANAGSFYYSSTDDTLYVHTSTGANPSTFAFVGAFFSLLLSTTAVTFPDQPIYLPLISGLPTLESEMPDSLFGATVSDTGELRVANTDGLFDKLARLWIWRNKTVTFKLGGAGLVYSQFTTVAVMRINRIDVGDLDVVLLLEDLGSILNQSLPPLTWGDGNLALTSPTEPGAFGTSQPLVFGLVQDCPLVLGNRDGTGDYWYAYQLLSFMSVMFVTVVAVNRATGARTTLTMFADYVPGAAPNVIKVTNATYYYETHDLIATLNSILSQSSFGSMARRILVHCGELFANWDDAAFTAADTAAPQVLARFMGEPRSAADWMRELEQSVNGQVYRGADGRWTCRVFTVDIPSSYVSLSDADFVTWEPTEDLASVLNEVRVRYGHKPLADDWIEATASDDTVQYGHETRDSHRLDTWLTVAADASAHAQHLRFFKSSVPTRIAFEERGLTLMGASVGDLVGVTRSRAPVGRTGRYDGQLLRILKLTKSLGTPSVSGVLGDLDGRADQIARTLGAAVDLNWSAATAEQKALYGFLADANGYIDATDVSTRFLKVVI